MKYYMGIDIGGTAIKAGIIDENGKVLYRCLTNTPPLGSSAGFADNIWTTAEKVKEEAEKMQLTLSGIGVSSAGQINTGNGVVIGACANIDNWIGTPIKDTLEKQFSLPVTVANDANCALLAECWLGNGKGYRHVVAYTIGTGVGGGILVDGKLLSGRDGIAGELGHSILFAGGEECTCGNHGCFEKYGSARAFVNKVKTSTGRSDLNGKIIFDEAQAGSKEMQQYIDEFLEIHANAITGFVHLFNPEIIIIGGGISAQGEILMAPLREKVLKKVMPAFGKDLIITTALLGNDAGMIGAVKNFMDLN